MRSTLLIASGRHIHRFLVHPTSMANRSRLDRMSSHIATCNGIKSAPTVATGIFTFKEIRIPVPWGYITGKEWGNIDGSCNPRRVLGLHGWQDNCGTFDPLMPLLLPDANLHFVAVDLPGHGLSSHRPPGGFYHLLEYVSDVRRIISHLNWDKGNISFLTHSMGSSVAAAYSACYPEQVDRLVMLDSIKPWTLSVRNLPLRMANTINRALEYEAKSSLPPRDVDINQAVELIVDAMNGSVSKNSALILLERGSKPAPGTGSNNRIIFTRDHRLKLESLPGILREQWLAIARDVRADLLIVLADEGIITFGYHLEEEVESFTQIYRENCRSFKLVHVEGTHHVHLNNPERVAPYIRDFLNTAD